MTSCLGEQGFASVPYQGTKKGYVPNSPIPPEAQLAFLEAERHCVERTDYGEPVREPDRVALESFYEDVISTKGCLEREGYHVVETPHLNEFVRVRGAWDPYQSLVAPDLGYIGDGEYLRLDGACRCPASATIPRWFAYGSSPFHRPPQHSQRGDEGGDFPARIQKGARMRRAFLMLTASALLSLHTGAATAAVTVGTDEPDTLAGTNGPDSLFGRAGDDGLFGRNADDALFGEAGADMLNGERGDDATFGGTGNDLLGGGSAAEFGNDAVHGGFGDDLFGGNPGADALFGEDGNDLMLDSPGEDLFSGGRGDDVIAIARFGPGPPELPFESDAIFCGPGLDRVEAHLVDFVAADCEVVTRTAG